MPLTLITHLTLATAKQIETHVPQAGYFQGRRVRFSRKLQKPKLAEIGNRAYLKAAGEAALEMGKDEDVFPATFADTGWTWEQVLDGEFYPD